MIGKTAYSITTGARIGPVTQETITGYWIENELGEDVEFRRYAVTFREDIAEEIAAKHPTPNTNRAYATDGSNRTKTPDSSGLATINTLVGILCLIGAVVGCITFWPDSTSLTIGYEYRKAAYIPAITSLVSGLVTGLIFFNFAALLGKK